MTRKMFAVSLVLAFAVTVAAGGPSKTRSATLATGEKPELAVMPAIPTVPVVVTNFPATQAVEGTVNVTGEVAISNLPAPCAEPTFAVLQIPVTAAVVEGLDCGCGPCYRFASTLDVAGWKSLSEKFVVTHNVGHVNLHDSTLAFRNFPNEPFGEPYAWAGSSRIATSAVVGAEAVLTSGLYCPSDISAIASAYFSVYLSR